MLCIEIEVVEVEEEASGLDLEDGPFEVEGGLPDLVFEIPGASGATTQFLAVVYVSEVPDSHNDSGS